MVRETIEARGVRDARVLAAMRRVPREAFVRDADSAYDDTALPIGRGQTISQPYVVALMAEALALPDGGRALDIGTGSGYAAAILAEVVGPAGEVRTIERIPELAEEAMIRLADLGYANVHVHVGDGTNGLAAFGPYDGIQVTAAAPDIPAPLLDQVADGGRIVAPVGDRVVQDLVVVRRVGRRFERRFLEGVRFVPLIGAHGWAA